MTEAPQYRAEVIHSIEELPASHWDQYTNGNPFLKHAFFSALETSGCASPQAGWQPYHLRLIDPNNQTAGIMPCYAKSHSFGEYVFDHAWANAYEQAGGRYYPKLQSSVPFTPATTPRLLSPSDEGKRTLATAIIALTQQLGVSSAHLTFLPKDEAQLLSSLGFLVRTDQQFHWRNKGYGSFEDFLDDLSSRKRKQIKKERRTALAGGIEIERLSGNQITEAHWDQFFIYYQDTGTRKWGRPYLNRDFFSLVHAGMPQNILLIMCKRNGRYVAGALNFFDTRTLYGRYWGCIEDHPCLHFEACYYQAIEHAIEHGLTTVEAGAQGPHKLARGYTPTKTYSAHWIPNENFKEAIANFLSHEREDVNAELSYLEALSPFKNQDR